MPRYKLRVFGAAVLACAAAMGLSAPTIANGSAASAVAERQALLTSMQRNMQALAGVARGRVEADPAAMRRQAESLRTAARRLDSAFDVDTRRSGAETEARPSIWTNKPDFDRKAAALVAASNTLVAKSGTGNTAEFRSALLAVGQTCKDCHTTYRAD